MVNKTAGARPEQLCHLLQGHTFGINLAAASLLASQMAATSYEDFEALFSDSHDHNRESAYQIAVAKYCRRVDDDQSMMVAISLIQTLIDSSVWDSQSVKVRVETNDL